MSYTTFAYSNLQLGCADMGEGAVLPVYVNVTNTGAVPGDEVVMLFVSFPNSTAARRTTIKELKGFARVSLNPGETKQVSIPVRLKDLDYYDQALGAWVVEDGPVTFMVGRQLHESPADGNGERRRLHEGQQQLLTQGDAMNVNRTNPMRTPRAFVNLSSTALTIILLGCPAGARAAEPGHRPPNQPRPPPRRPKS